MRSDSDGNVFYADNLTLHAFSTASDSRNRTLEFAEFTVRACNAHDALVDALKVLVELSGSECHLDHHGNCQEHYISKPCPIAVAVDALKCAGQNADATK